ncbi:MAG: phosphoadenylyl-sulfate reductase [Acidimicrobiales bacterium]
MRDMSSTADIESAALDLVETRIESVTTVRLVPAAQRFSNIELVELNERFEHAPAGTIIRWAHETFGEGLCLTASMQDTVLIDLAVKVDPAVEVIFLDTGYHFPETLETAEAVRTRYGLNLNIVSPLVDLDDRWMDDPDGCCQVRKVEPMNRALADKTAWLSGLRRDEASTRASAPIISRDRRGLIKINPLAGWTHDDVAGYAADHDLISNPLLAAGFPSIGCWPCTRKVRDGEDARAGRWTGFAKTECGIHD